MADFTNLNLEGANEKLNKALTDAKALKDNLLASAGGDASTILASLESKVSDLQSSFADMIPELPTIPNINMQSEFATLSKLNITSPQYPSQIANITSQFGPAMKAKGLDIESLARQILAGGSIGDLLPNLQLPDGELVPVELPAEVTLPSKESVKEETPKVDKETNASLKTKDIEKNKKIARQVERWDLFARLTPTLFLVTCLILILFNIVSLEYAFYIGLSGFAVTAVTWWWWAIFTVKYLITVLNRASKGLNEVNTEIKRVKEELAVLKDEQ